MNQLLNEKTSKQKNILHHLYTILCYIVYIVFTFFMVFLFIYSTFILFRVIIDLLQSKHISPHDLPSIVAIIAITICSAICMFKSEKAIRNKTFHLYRIIIIFLIILSITLLVVTLNSCYCSIALNFEMLICSVLLIPLTITMNYLIKKNKNLTSNSKIIINRILIGVISIISLCLIARLIRIASIDPHKMPDNAIIIDAFNIPNTQTSNNILSQELK